VIVGSRRPIWIAVAGNCIVAGLTYAVLGWNATAGHAAARNTARFSVMWLAIAFAAPGLVRFVRVLPEETRLTQAFVSAHLVHFVSVGLLLTLFEWTHVRQNRLELGITVLIGAGSVITVGLTATPRASRLYSGVHRVFLYIVFLIFLLAYGRHPFRPLRLVAVLLIIALVLRLGRRLAFYSARARAAG
jgi:hypothetical protein